MSGPTINEPLETRDVDTRDEAAPSPCDVLDERARRLAVPAEEEREPAEMLEVVRFRVGRESYALETRFVLEVLPSADVTRLLGRTDALLGFLNLRGNVLALMDPARVLGVRAVDEAEWLVIVGDSRPEFALAVRRVDGVIALPREEVLPATSGVRIVTTGLVTGVTREGMVLLDGHRLLVGEEFVIEDAEV